MKRTWMIAASAALAAALVGASFALAAYTSPKLEVRQVGEGIAIKASLSPDDDATARIAVIVPPGTQLTTTQAPGTVLGPVRGRARVLDLGADLPLAGSLIVAAPGQIPATTQTACLGPIVPLATWAMALQAASQELVVPAYLVATSGGLTALGPAAIVVCFPPPDVPAGTPGRAPFGVKLYGAELAVNGVFSPGTGVWVSLWLPYTPGAGTFNEARTVGAPAVVHPGSLTIAATRARAGAAVAGRVTQDGQPRAGAIVTVRGGPRTSALRRLGTITTNASGIYTFRAKTGTFFRTTAVATASAAPSVCATIQPALGGIACVNPTSSGFTVSSRTIRKK